MPTRAEQAYSDIEKQVDSQLANLKGLLDGVDKKYGNSSVKKTESKTSGYRELTENHMTEIKKLKNTGSTTVCDMDSPIKTTTSQSSRLFPKAKVIKNTLDHPISYSFNSDESLNTSEIKKEQVINTKSSNTRVKSHGSKGNLIKTSSHSNIDAVISKQLAESNAKVFFSEDGRLKLVLTEVGSSKKNPKVAISSVPEKAKSSTSSSSTQTEQITTNSTLTTSSTSSAKKNKRKDLDFPEIPAALLTPKESKDRVEKRKSCQKMKEQQISSKSLTKTESSDKSDVFDFSANLVINKHQLVINGSMRNNKLKEVKINDDVFRL